MKAGLGLRLEVFFLVFGMEADYRFACERATLILSKQKNLFRGHPAHRQSCHIIGQGVLALFGAARSKILLSNTSAVGAE